MTEVAFFLDDPRSTAELQRLDPQRDWRELVRGERVWILKTWLHLRAAGHPVRLVDEVPGTGMVVFHAKQRRALVRALVTGGQRVPSCVLVGVRADLRQPYIADFEILQSSRWSGPNRFAIGHWPQGGLVPRDVGRGSRVENVVFKGFAANLAEPFRKPEWREALAQRGLTWQADAVEFAERGTAAELLEWNDYGKVDLVLAVRPPDRELWASKPASKLANAWRAGVPALLGPEWAYRQLRRDPLDYLEVATPVEALDAIDRLRASPELYQEMVNQGRSRAAEVSETAVLAQWEEILFERIPRRMAADPGLERMRRWPLGLRSWIRRMQRILARLPAR